MVIVLVLATVAYVLAHAAWKGTSPKDEVLYAFGVAQRPPDAAPITGALNPPGASSPGGIPGHCGQLIGFPNQGTHNRGNWESDNAIDIAAPEGTPIRAPFTGRIGMSYGYDPTGGNRLHIHGAGGNPVDSYFAHLSRYARGIVPGKTVIQGQVIGYVGNTGNARGGPPHLHFSVIPPWHPQSFAAGTVAC